MPCRRFGDAILCGPSGPYEYEGILWELHSYLGPHPIRRKDGNPWLNPPKSVWEIANRFAREKDKSKF